MIDYTSDDFLHKAIIAKFTGKNEVMTCYNALNSGWCRAFSKKGEELVVWLLADTLEQNPEGKNFYKVKFTCPRGEDPDQIATNEGEILWYNESRFFKDGLVMGRYYKTPSGEWRVALVDKIKRAGWLWAVSMTNGPALVYVKKPLLGPKYLEDRKWYIYKFDEQGKNRRPALFLDSPKDLPKKLSKSLPLKKAGCLQQLAYLWMGAIALIIIEFILFAKHC